MQCAAVGSRRSIGGSNPCFILASPRDRRTGSCWSCRACAMARRRRGGSWAGSRPPAPPSSWNSRGIPVGQDDQVAPTDYFNGLVASAAGRLPQPLSAADLADLWDSLWFLLMAAADGKLSENFSPLENEWDRQDQLRWFLRDDPPPTPTAGASEVEALAAREDQGKWSPRPSERWNSICAENGRNGSLPTSPPLRSTLHTCRTSARRHWASWGTAGSGRSGNIAWYTRVSAREASP